MPINAALFAHIQNDSSLEGTYGLQGIDFITTISYLNEYLKKNGDYRDLQEQLEGMKTIG